jgi:hypothetical protein
MELGLSVVAPIIVTRSQVARDGHRVSSRQATGHRTPFDTDLQRRQRRAIMGLDQSPTLGTAKFK